MELATFVIGMICFIIAAYLLLDALLILINQLTGMEKSDKAKNKKAAEYISGAIFLFIWPILFMLYTIAL